MATPNNSRKEPEMADRRKKWFWGLSREGWVTIVTAIFVTGVGYGALSERVSGNEKNSIVMKADVMKAMDDFKIDVRAQFAQMREDQKADIDRLIIFIKSRP